FNFWAILVPPSGFSASRRMVKIETIFRFKGESMSLTFFLEIIVNCLIKLLIIKFIIHVFINMSKYLGNIA
ncbi:MAG: hypothetical protein H6Q46_200, partial [Deltaproteobacteria bacterium]|nr:hypothetical protein [Deltaproteobacteria bacterium]